MHWRVSDVCPLENYCLKVQFLDGSHGIVDMHQLVASKRAGVFAALRDKTLFNQVFIQYGAVNWPGEIDLSPDTMYHEIKKTGLWILQ